MRCEVFSPDGSLLRRVVAAGFRRRRPFGQAKRNPAAIILPYRYISARRDLKPGGNNTPQHLDIDCAVGCPHLTGTDPAE